MKNRFKTLLAIGVLTFTMAGSVSMAEEDVDGGIVGSDFGTSVETYAETPAVETQQIETPVAETPQTEAQAVETPQTEAPVYETPETPQTEAPVYETPQTEASAVETPQTGNQSYGSSYSGSYSSGSQYSGSSDTSSSSYGNSSTGSYTDTGSYTGTGSYSGTTTDSSAAAGTTDTGILSNSGTETEAAADTSDLDVLTEEVISESGLMTQAESHEIVSSSEVSSSIVGFSVDASKYPAADTSENTRYIYQYLREEMGLNHAGACGVLANIQMESAFNPLALGDSGTSYGICQWHNSRFNSLINYCNSNALDYNTLDGQLAYLYYELQASYPGVLSYLRSVADTAQGAYDAGYYWCVHFEMPENSTGNGALRGNLAANEYYPLDFSYESEDAVDLQLSTENAVALVRAAIEANTTSGDNAIIASIRELLNQEEDETSNEAYEAQAQQMLNAVLTIRESLASGN